MKREINISRGIANAKKRKENEAVQRILELEMASHKPNEISAIKESVLEAEPFIEVQLTENISQNIFLPHQSKLRPLIRGFDIKDLIRKFKDAILFDAVDEHDSKNIICLGSKTTKKKFSCAIEDWKNEFYISEDALESLWNILYNSFGEFVNLPVKVRSQCTSNMETLEPINEDDILSISTQDLHEPKVTSNIDKYTREPSRFISVDQCVNDCCVYIGESFSLLQCSVCQNFRFRSCCRSSCPGKGTHSCSHLVTADGIPFKQFHYRFLIILIMDLVKTDWFVNALNFTKRIFVHETARYSDVCDGEECKKHLNEMQLSFNAWKEADIVNRSSAVPVNLLLSEFYDGTQLFKSRAADFWALLIGILNLPPSYRGKIGWGYFVAAIYEGSHAFAERVIFIDFLCQELRSLYKGIEFFANGNHYFIQARLILHILDTKAGEGLMRLQMVSNSKFGCPLCRCIHGIHDGKKCIFMGHRNLLPQKHYLRFLGQSGKCCPSNFYDNNRWFAFEKFEDPAKGTFSISDFTDVVEIQTAVAKAEKRKKGTGTTVGKGMILKRRDLINSFCSSCQTESDELRDEIIKFIFLQPDEAYVWFHSKDFHFQYTSIFRQYLHYRHFDFRKFKEYNRVAYDVHLADAVSATQRSDGILNGIKGIWPFERLQYANITTQFSWPMAHSCCGCIVLLLELMCAKYTASDPSKKKISISKEDVDAEFSEEDGDAFDETTFEYCPYYRPKYIKSSAPYSAGNQDVIKVCCWLRCVLLPSGITENSWDIDLSSIGSLNMNQKLKTIQCFWDIILFGFSTSIEKPYRLFYKMFADDMKRMLSLSIPKDDINDLQNCIIETVATWEGMLPPKTLNFKLHELVDLPSQIRHFGPPSRVSEFPGERMLGMIKKLKLMGNSGGVSYGKTMMKKEVLRELRVLRKTFAKPSPMHKTNINKISLDCENQSVYNEFPFFLSKMESRELVLLTDFELDFLIRLLLTEVERLFTSVPERREKSVLFRLFDRKINSRVLTRHEMLEQYLVIDDLPAEEKAVCQNLLNFRSIMYKNATIYGNKFSSRGSKFREMCKPINKNTSYGAERGSEVYDIRRADDFPAWFDKVARSSWCMYLNNDNEVKFGQLNCFFSIDIGDISLKGLLIASITSRKSKCIDSVTFINEYNSLDMSTLFVPLQDICPTLIATVPFQENNLAISIKHNRVSMMAGQEMEKFVSTDVSKISKHAMIVLHPEKLSSQPVARPFSLIY